MRVYLSECQELGSWRYGGRGGNHWRSDWYCGCCLASCTSPCSWTHSPGCLWAPCCLHDGPASCGRGQRPWDPGWGFSAPCPLSWFSEALVECPEFWLLSSDYPGRISVYLSWFKHSLRVITLVAQLVFFRKIWAGFGWTTGWVSTYSSTAHSASSFASILLWRHFSGPWAAGLGTVGCSGGWVEQLPSKSMPSYHLSNSCYLSCFFHASLGVYPPPFSPSWWLYSTWNLWGFGLFGRGVVDWGGHCDCLLGSKIFTRISRGKALFLAIMAVRSRNPLFSKSCECFVFLAGAADREKYRFLKVEIGSFDGSLFECLILKGNWSKSLKFFHDLF